MSKEIEQAVDVKLAAWCVSFSVALVGEIKRDEWICDEWRVKIGAIETMFHTGVGHRKQHPKAPKFNGSKTSLAYEEWSTQYVRPTAPSAASVLHSLILDSSATEQCFNDWCDDYGYDNDSMKALITYQACCAIGQDMRRVFTHAQREELRELLQDY